MTATILNLDAVVCETVEIQKTPPGETAPRVYALRDDVPTETMVGCFRLLEAAERFDAAGAVGEKLDAFEALRAQALAACTAIFRHTLPAIEEAEVARVFSYEEQARIIELFFTRRSARSAAPPSDTDRPSPASPPRPNRAARRSRKA